jgi:hypothetical protein
VGEEDTVLQALNAYSEASAVLAPLVAAVRLLGLLRGASTSGLLEVTRISSSPRKIAETLSLDEERVVAVCEALAAHGVLDKHEGLYTLAGAWTTLAAPDAMFPLEAVLDGAFAEAGALRAATGGAENYWTFSPAERLALARGVTVNPASPLSPGLMEAAFRVVPELHLRLTDGARYLELGCGVAGALLSILRLYPNTTAVGVDLAADVLEVARLQAVALGVAERVVLRQGDARDVAERDTFDYVFWSQFFFPASSRTGALFVALRALKPGGFLIAPLLTGASDISIDPQSDQGRSGALDRVMYGAWHIPVADAANLEQEVAAAGFGEVRTVTTPFNQIVVGRRPLDVDVTPSPLDSRAPVK